MDYGGWLGTVRGRGMGAACVMFQTPAWCSGHLASQGHVARRGSNEDINWNFRGGDCQHDLLVAGVRARLLYDSPDCLQDGV